MPKTRLRPKGRKNAKKLLQSIRANSILKKYPVTEITEVVNYKARIIKHIARGQ